ncbi:hypothetical protein M378DRAFT_1029718 [Amanita muscaria Koide BX008]|uniref:Uncharacterized protein n=1 Tax=Amanita muscaria (strain Koide BX008) TaxID=946122 RepID=A0A0C2W7N1_AMAMK|nr:hypothetical protein M378DRAFT_1029718 [Amanita muscaria Koide BX008]
MRSSPSVAKEETKWRDEARFAGMYELGMCLRWGLARAVRTIKGQEVRGLIPWDIYLKFRESEAAKRYPPGHFQTCLDDLSPTIQAITNTVLILLIHTPRSGPSGSASAALGVPARLKDWIKSYPASLPFLNDPKKDTAPQPCKGARTVRLLNVRRNVRLYSTDLVRIAATWGSRATPRLSAGPSNTLYLSKEWERVAPTTLKLPPKYSEAFKKRMNIPQLSSRLAPSTSSYMSSASSASSAASGPSEKFGSLTLNPREGEDRFRSLTDMRWGEFESMGFGSIGEVDKKLEFDLTEGARQKRQTLSWNDFSAAGFSRTDAPLSTTLQFTGPALNTVASWPSQKVEISKKLNKAEKSLPHFGWDTEPVDVVFNEEVIEEAFLDVFCNLIYGGGWMDGERYEEIDRDSNWALVSVRRMGAEIGVEKPRDEYASDDGYDTDEEDSA